MNQLIGLSLVVTKFFVTSIAVRNVKSILKNKNWRDEISRKIDIDAADTIRLDISTSKRYFDIFDIEASLVMCSRHPVPVTTHAAAFYAP